MKPEKTEEIKHPLSTMFDARQRTLDLGKATSGIYKKPLTVIAPIDMRPDGWDDRMCEGIIDNHYVDFSRLMDEVYVKPRTKHQLKAAGKRI